MTDVTAFVPVEPASPQAGDWAGEVKTGTGSVLFVGYAALFVFAVIFGVWASTAPLSGAAIADGVVAAAGRNQVVQHLEGGIIKALHVEEGDRVRRGDAMFEIDATQARATVESLSARWVYLKARQFRLEAQRDRAAETVFNAPFAAEAERLGLTAALSDQRAEYAARLSRYTSEVAILTKRADASQKAIVGYRSQLEALQAQLAVVDDETERKKRLLDQGLTNRSEYTALLRTQAELVGQIGAMTAQIEQTRLAIAQAEEQLVRQDTEWVETALGELNEVTAAVGDLEGQLESARDVLDRVTVRAPSDGIIIAVHKNTIGSVVRPGDELADLLPTSSDLIIEARLKPSDIDAVRVGQTADMRFVALNSRVTPQVPGEIAFISPDRLVDQSTQQPYYMARLRITEELPANLDREQIYPGMPVEVYVSTGERTFLEYLVKPLTDSFSRAFREE
ncbi:HlyD family type I secretion periplasmic adaptor subunit [Oricola sp.]|uniref:HlyD family type I secretion periplasmic adaptor subunit n=1 Tax=Oricola sp. TaxID=1979950 RepID=UPI003BAB364C